MFNIVKYIGYAFKAKQGMNAPQDLLADTSFGLVEGFFILSFIALGIVGIGSVFVGFNYGYGFFKVFGIIMLLILILDIIIYRKVKKFIQKMSNQVTDNVKQHINYYKTVDVEVTDVQ